MIDGTGQLRTRHQLGRLYRGGSTEKAIEFVSEPRVVSMLSANERFASYHSIFLNAMTNMCWQRGMVREIHNARHPTS